jgi:hypothetical protein
VSCTFQFSVPAVARGRWAAFLAARDGKADEMAYFIPRPMIAMPERLVIGQGETVDFEIRNVGLSWVHWVIANSRNIVKFLPAMGTLLPGLSVRTTASVEPEVEAQTVTAVLISDGDKVATTIIEIVQTASF